MALLFYFDIFIFWLEGVTTAGWLVHRNLPKSPNVGVGRKPAHEKIVGVVRLAT